MRLILLLSGLLALEGTYAAEPLPHRPASLSLRNEIELAIDQGLGWLQKAQSPEGSWSLAEQPALTALSLSAFMGQPSGKYRQDKPEFVQRGYDFLASSAQPDGGIYRKGLANYNTSLALNALVSANDPKFQPLISAGRAFVIGQQAKGLANSSLDGGIGYGPAGTGRQHPDLSNTVIALDALAHSKRAAGKELPDDKDLDLEAAIGFIQRCQNLTTYNPEPWASDDAENKGGFVYFPGESMAGQMDLPNGKKALRSYGSMSYAGLLSYIYAELKKDDPRVQAVQSWLTRHYTLDENPGMGAEGVYYYYHMMAKALAASGLRELEVTDEKKVSWANQLGRKLIDLQQPDGSWTNTSGRWMEKDPVLVTSYAVLTLEIIYRSL